MALRLVEIPAYLAGRFAVDHVGRRLPLIGGLLVGGLACLATGLVPEGLINFFSYVHILILNEIYHRTLLIRQNKYRLISFLK